MGSSNYDEGRAIALDSSGNVYVTGFSYDSWGSPKNPFAGNNDAFVATFNSSGTRLWNTFMGGGAEDRGYGIALDSAADVYVTGYSYATWGSPLNPFAGYIDAFVAKLDTSGNRLWNTFVGASDYNYGTSIALDSSGNVYVAGYSTATWGSPINPFAGSNDAFVAKLNNECDVNADCPVGEYCSNSLCVTPVCGNGQLEINEVCEQDSDCTQGQYCDECQCVEPVCGNGLKEPGEQCEQNSDCAEGDYCSDCACVTPVCGNSVIEPGEQCEQNTDCADGQYCNNCICAEPVCGNGVLEPGEMCEQGSDCQEGYTCNNCQCEIATLIRLSSFEATAGNGRVTLKWSTETEIDNAGFNLYRSEVEDGKYVKINRSLVPAKGSATQGASYEFIDTGVQNRRIYFYKLEDIDLNGNSTMHGPVSAMPRMIYGISNR